MPKTIWVSGPSLIWKRGSALPSVDKRRSNRPSSGLVVRSGGKETSKRTAAGAAAANRNQRKQPVISPSYRPLRGDGVKLGRTAVRPDGYELSIAAACRGGKARRERQPGSD